MSRRFYYKPPSVPGDDLRNPGLRRDNRGDSAKHSLTCNHPERFVLGGHHQNVNRSEERILVGRRDEATPADTVTHAELRSERTEACAKIVRTVAACDECDLRREKREGFNQNAEIFLRMKSSEKSDPKRGVRITRRSAADDSFISIEQWTANDRRARIGPMAQAVTSLELGRKNEEPAIRGVQSRERGLRANARFAAGFVNVEPGETLVGDHHTRLSRELRCNQRGEAAEHPRPMHDDHVEAGCAAHHPPRERHADSPDSHSSAKASGATDRPCRHTVGGKRLADLF